jgi:phage FluMu protein Com
MQEVRCKKCGKLLAKITMDQIIVKDQKLKAGQCMADVAKYDAFSLEIKCPRCGEMNVRKENVENVDKKN